MTTRTELTKSQAKAINASRTMGWLRAEQRLGREVVVGKTVDVDALGNTNLQVRTGAAAYDWIITPRGRIVAEDRTEIK